MGANLYEFSDRAFLHVVHEIQDEEKDNWAPIEEIAVRMKIQADKPTRDCGSRLAWLKRYGMVEYHPEEKGKWRVSRAGRALMFGNLSEAAEAVIGSADAAETVTLVRELARRQRLSQGKARGHMMRREWQRGTMTPR